MHEGHARHIRRIETPVLIAIGGFAGANLRYFVGEQVAGQVGTLLVNVAGSFALGLLLYEAHFTGVLSERTHVAVGTGFLSSLSTYSTFALQTLALGTPLGAGYVLASYALAFGGVLAGRHVAVWLERGRWL
ncbi:MAG: CrcB family protein [Halanaeroarchaeum sp.]